METMRPQEPVRTRLTAQQRASIEPSSDVPRRKSRTADVQQSQSSRRHTPTMTTDVDEDLYDDDLPGRMPKSVRRYRSSETEPHGVIPAGQMRERTARTVAPMQDRHRYNIARDSSNLRNKKDKYAWSLPLGVGMLVALLIAFLIINAPYWWHSWRSSIDDPIKYGSTHSTQVVMNLGGDGEKQPSIIKSFNVNGKIGINVYYGGDATKVKEYICPNAMTNVHNIQDANVDIQVYSKQIQVIALGPWTDGSNREHDGCIMGLDGKGNIIPPNASVK